MTATPQCYHATITCPIVKADDDEKRLVTGVVLQPDVEDAHGDTVTADVIEGAAHAFVAKYNEATKLGVQHKLFGFPDIHLAESYLAPDDMVIGGQPVLKGTWVMTVKVLNDDIWDGIKDGSLTGFSIGAIATVPAVLDDEEPTEVESVKSTSASVALEKSRPLLALVVSEVSLVDAAANERKFLVTKALAPPSAPQEPPMAAKSAKPTFTVTHAVAKDMGKIKQLSKELALERLSAASGMIEALKADFESFTDIGQLWKAVDDIHGMLWPVEGDISTAALKSFNAAGHTLELSDDVKAAITNGVIEAAEEGAAAIQAQLTKAVEDAMAADGTLDTLVTKTIEAVKAKSVTPKRIAQLSALAEGLTAAIAEMAPAAGVGEGTEGAGVEKAAGGLTLDAISALLDSKLEPVAKRLDALEAAPAEPETVDAEVQKAKVSQELAEVQKAREEAEAKAVTLQKQLEELEAGPTSPDDDDEPADADAPVQKSIWKSVIHQPTRKSKEAARRAVPKPTAT